MEAHGARDVAVMMRRRSVLAVLALACLSAWPAHADPQPTVSLTQDELIRLLKAQSAAVRAEDARAEASAVQEKLRAAFAPKAPEPASPPPEPDAKP